MAAVWAFGLLVAMAFSCPAATVTFTMTNSFGQADTNFILVTPVNPHANADGSYVTAGIPFRLRPNSSGYVATNLPTGTYLATNRFIVSTFAAVGSGSGGTDQGILFNVDNTTNSYPFTRYLRSGYNIYNWYLGIMGISGTNGFLVITNGDGTVTIDGNNFAPSSNSIYSAVGDLFATKTSLLTTSNRFQTFSPTNSGTDGQFVSKTGTNAAWATASGGSGSNSVSSANATTATIATNGQNFSLTVFIQTNGITTLSTTNKDQVVMTNSLVALTNRFVTTNFPNAVSLTNNANSAGTFNFGMVQWDDNFGGKWLLYTNAAGQMLFRNTTSGGIITFKPDSTLDVQNINANIVSSYEFRGGGLALTNLNATQLTNGTVPLARLSNITSNQLDTSTWQQATNRNGGIAANVTSGFSSGGWGLSNVPLSSITNSWSVTNVNWNAITNQPVIPSTNGYASKTYVDGRDSVISNRFQQLFPTNSGTDGQSLTKTGTNALWATISGAGGIGIATNGGVGTNNTFIGPMITSGIFTNGSTIYPTLGSDLNSSNFSILQFGTGNFLGGGDVIFSSSRNGITNANFSTIVGGTGNKISPGSSISSAGILAGRNNSVTRDSSAIIAGEQNSVTGSFSAVISGTNNTVWGANSLASGAGAKAANAFTFVWSDGQAFSSSNTNQFLIKSANGVGINTNNPSGFSLLVGGSLGAQSITTTNVTINGGLVISSGSTNLISVQLAGNPGANGTFIYMVNQYTNPFTSYTITNNAGTWIVRDETKVGALYTSATIVNSAWTLGSGAAPAPSTTLGYTNDMTGAWFTGIFNSTNSWFQITNYSKPIYPTNQSSGVDGNVLVKSGGNAKWQSAPSSAIGATFATNLVRNYYDGTWDTNQFKTYAAGTTNPLSSAFYWSNSTPVGVGGYWADGITLGPWYAVYRSSGNYWSLTNDTEGVEIAVSTNGPYPTGFPFRWYCNDTVEGFPNGFFSGAAQLSGIIATSQVAMTAQSTFNPIRRALVSRAAPIAFALAPGSDAIAASPISNLTNVVNFLKASKLDYIYREIILDDGWLSAEVTDQTINFVHTNGFFVGLWSSFQGPTSQNYTDKKQFYNSFSNWCAWGVDEIKLDNSFVNYFGEPFRDTSEDFLQKIHYFANMFGRPVMVSNKFFRPFDSWMCNYTHWDGLDGPDSDFTWTTFIRILNGRVRGSLNFGGEGRFPFFAVMNFWGGDTNVMRGALTMAAITGARFMSCNTNYTAATYTILTNMGWYMIHQDDSGVPGVCVFSNTASVIHEEIWVRPLRNGDRAVAFLVPTNSAANVTFKLDFQNLGWPTNRSYTARSMWWGSNITCAGSLSITLGTNNTADLYRILDPGF